MLRPGNVYPYLLVIALGCFLGAVLYYVNCNVKQNVRVYQEEPTDIGKLCKMNTKFRV